MKKYRIRFCKLFLVGLFITCTGAIAADSSFTPGVINFSRDEYRGASQNWSVCQDSTGFIFVANSNGLLEYDGFHWTLYPSHGGNIIRAVACGPQGRIYSSGYRELGYWSRNGYGKLDYTSLNSLADSLFNQNVEFWKIVILGNKVLFQSFTQLLIYENGKITSVNFRDFVNSVYHIDNQLFVNVLNQGIYKLSGNKLETFITGDIFKEVIVRFILPYGENTYLLGTDSHGILISEKGKVTEWNTPLNDSFKKNRINRGCYTKTGDLVVGTILDGIYLVNSKGELVWNLNAGKGLQNNTVLGIHPDASGNLWLALDQGIDLVLTSGYEGVQMVRAEKIGAVYTAAVFADSLYLGTNQGVFAGSLKKPQDTFRLIPGTQGQVWDLKVIGDHLIAGHNSGTFQISGGKATFISKVSGAFSITKDARSDQEYLQCTYSNIVKYRLEQGVLRQKHVYYNFNELIRFIETDHLENLWLSHMHRGIFQLRYFGDKDSVVFKRYIDPEKLGEHSVNPGVFKVNERIVFTSGLRLYTYDDLQDTIIPYNTLNVNLGKYAAATRIIASGESHYWFITEQSIGLLKIIQNTVSVVREFPREIFGTRLIRQYENIIPLTTMKAILCLENGYALLDGSVASPQCSFCRQMPYPGEIFLSGKTGKVTAVPIISKIIKMPNDNNNLTIKWAFPHFSVPALQFWWYLDGISADWINKGNSRTISWERLPPGKYVLKAKVSDVWGYESQIYSIPVVVLPPWYASLVAKICYLLLVALLLIIFRIGIIRKIKIAEQRKREESDKELVKLKNEKLQAEIAYKVKELGSSTMMIIQKNKILSDLKELVQKQKSIHNPGFSGKQYNEIIRKIESTLSSHDDWKTFEITFDEAHQSFMKNLKRQYPDLSPKDIRLCAFLRMNLPSKEIAPLLGISVRGVENHRYRLRRKMNLEHDENLIEVILSL